MVIYMARHYGKITKQIMVYIATAGVIALAATSPSFGIHVFRALLKEPSSRKKFSQALQRLKQSRLIIVKEKQDGVMLVELTEKGKRKMREFQFSDLTLKRPKIWDGIWRVVIFDIPNKKTGARETFRTKLKNLEFYQLQESVWVSPYPCQPEIEFVIELLGIYRYVNILEAKNIKDDVKLRKYFSLL